MEPSGTRFSLLSISIYVVDWLEESIYDILFIPHLHPNPPAKKWPIIDDRGEVCG
jgi:hypothetical protein